MEDIVTRLVLRLNTVRCQGQIAISQDKNVDALL